MSSDDSRSSSENFLLEQHQSLCELGDPVSHYGWGVCRPKCLRAANSQRCLLFWMCMAAIVIGIISGSFEVTFVSVCMILSLMASRPGTSKPMWIGSGLLVVSLGSLVYAAPHFLTPPNKILLPISHIGNTTEGLCAVQKENNFINEYNQSLDVRYFFILGQVLHALGATPIIALGIAFLDENVSKKVSSLYIGIYNAMFVGGAAIGYAIGSALLGIYIDWPLVDPLSEGLTPSSDLWLGCWWLCFMVSSTAAVLVAIPIMGFPPQVAQSEKYRNRSIRYSAVRLASSSEQLSSNITSTFVHLKRVLCNKPFMFLAFAECFPSLLAGGFNTFMPKIVESQFSLSASSAAFIVGSCGVVAGCLGSFFGGWVLKKFRVGCLGSLKLCSIVSVVLTIFSVSFLLYCPNEHFAGVNIPYDNNKSSLHMLPDLYSECNANCDCGKVSYNPICGADNFNYYSPCHAGCTQVHTINTEQMYSNCSCINAAFLSGRVRLNGLTWDEITSDAETLHQGIALRNRCPSSCTMLPTFIVLFIVVIFISFSIGIASISAGLRCVQKEERSIAFGVRAQIVRLLGNVPGPILFGAFLDRTCILWEEMDNVRGSCAIYDLKRMDWTVMFITLVSRTISTLFYIIAVWTYSSLSKEVNTSGVSTLPDSIQFRVGNLSNCSSVSIGAPECASTSIGSAQDASSMSSTFNFTATRGNKT